MRDHLAITAFLAYFLIAGGMYVGEWTFWKFRKRIVLAKCLITLGFGTLGICYFIKFAWW